MTGEVAASRPSSDRKTGGVQWIIVRKLMQAAAGGRALCGRQIPRARRPVLRPCSPRDDRAAPAVRGLVGEGESMAREGGGAFGTSVRAGFVLWRRWLDDSRVNPQWVSISLACRILC